MHSINGPQPAIPELSHDEEGYLLGVATACGRISKTQVVLALPKRENVHHWPMLQRIKSLVQKSGGRKEECWIANGQCHVYYYAAPALLPLVKQHDVCESGMSVDRLWDEKTGRLFPACATPMTLVHPRYSLSYVSGFLGGLIDSLGSLKKRYDERSGCLVDALSIFQPDVASSLVLLDIFARADVECVVEVRNTTGVELFVCGQELVKLQRALKNKIYD